MLEVIEVKEMPPGLKLTSWAKRDYDEASDLERRRLLQRSSAMWVMMEDEHVVMVLGVFQGLFVGGRPELWMLLCDDFRVNLKANLKFCRNKLPDLLALYPNIQVRIDASYPMGTKFARFMGFTPFKQGEAYHGREMLLYEVK